MPDSRSALIVVDIQNDFLPGGALAVPSGDSVIDPASRLMADPRWRAVVVTQDWHPSDHVSFAAQHENCSPFQEIELSYGPQVLWPVHCVAGSAGAALPASLSDRTAHLVIRKGMNREVDSYSAFVEADGVTRTGLAGYLRERGIDRVVICGLALDFCVRFTAEDAARAGFATAIVEDACAAISPEANEALFAQLAALGITRVMTDDVLRD